MNYDNIADLIEAHKVDMARAIATETLLRDLPVYNVLAVDQLAPLVQNTIEKMIDYLREQDVIKWRDFLTGIAEKRLKDGLALEELNMNMEMLFSKITEIIERELPGPNNERTRLRYERRLQGIRSLTQVTGVNIRLKYNERLRHTADDDKDYNI